METIVALDIETTGLDPEKDAIIEIGAVRFNDRRIEDEWHTLIHPGRRIPPPDAQRAASSNTRTVRLRWGSRYESSEKRPDSGA